MASPLQKLRRRILETEKPKLRLPVATIVSVLLLPATAERPVKLHETLVLGAARPCKC